MNDTNFPIDTIITIKDWKTKVINREHTMNYHQNDTVIVILAGKVEIIDKQAFRDMLHIVNDNEDSILAYALLTVLNGN
jgi:hypothetical protein